MNMAAIITSFPPSSNSDSVITSYSIHYTKLYDPHPGSPGGARHPHRHHRRVITSYSIHYTKLYEATLEERVARIERDYVVAMAAHYCQQLGEEAGQQALHTFLSEGLARLTRRLGDLNYRRLDALLQQALSHQAATGETWHRITSYNVCYTKLLRGLSSWQMSRSGWGSFMAGASIV